MTQNKDETFDSKFNYCFKAHSGRRLISGDLTELKQLHDEEIKKHLIIEVDLRLQIYDLNNDIEKLDTDKVNLLLQIDNKDKEIKQINDYYLCKNE